tara:strand:+ start:6150 stop:6725 length:576 start_codon:yes stop_codon:yes gene_type:complete
MSRQLILASASPRRTDLMNEAGLTFKVIPADVEELEDTRLGIEPLVSQNAALKARAVSKQHREAIVIGADTLVALDDHPLGKPKDLDHAFEMLSSLAGRTHVVCTGVCLSLGESGTDVQFIEQTEVTFRNLDATAIREYLGLINPLDKAGSYAAQDHGDRIIASTNGSWTNVVGLPMERLLAELEKLRLSH